MKKITIVLTIISVVINIALIVIIIFLLKRTCHREIEWVQLCANPEPGVIMELIINEHIQIITTNTNGSVVKIVNDFNIGISTIFFDGHIGNISLIQGRPLTKENIQSAKGLSTTKFVNFDIQNIKECLPMNTKIKPLFSPFGCPS